MLAETWTKHFFSSIQKVAAKLLFPLQPPAPTLLFF